MSDLTADWEAAKPVRANLAADWDAAKPIASSPRYGMGEAAGMGGLQGLTMGTGDELSGSFSAGQKQIERMPELLGVPDADLYALAMADNTDYTKNRDQARTENAAAEKQHPYAYGAGEFAGAAAPAMAASALGIPTAGVPGLLSAAGQGVIQGAGYSNGTSAREVAADSALGGALGTAGHFAGEALGRGGQKLVALAKSKALAATGRAAAQAGEERAGQIASAAGKYGGLRQTENKAILNMLEREKSGLLDQSRLAKLDGLKKSGRVAEAINETADNDLEFLATRTPEVAAAKSELQTLQAEAPRAIAARTEELSKPQIGKDVLSFAKSYAEPLVWAGAGQQLASALGMDPSSQGVAAGAAGLVGGRTRAGKALINRLTRPGNQIKLMDALEKAAKSPNTTLGQMLLQALSRGGPSLAADALVTQ